MSGSKMVRVMVGVVGVAALALALLLTANYAGATRAPAADFNTAVGNAFRFDVDGNPTTGYEWQAQYDEGFLQLADRTYTAPSSGLLGAGGKFTFTFKALREGETTIKLLYKRPWETAVAETKEYTVRIAAGATAPKTGEVSQAESQQIAEQFLRNSATFKFDGLTDSVQLTNAEALFCSSCWEFTFDYQTRQAGHGDRSGQMLAQVITNHTAKITVEQGKVTSAICDGDWDMLK
ncbi:MAG: protease inhibitor I42 family protein [Chloroflexota bacterium]